MVHNTVSNIKILNYLPLWTLGISVSVCCLLCRLKWDKAWSQRITPPPTYACRVSMHVCVHVEHVQYTNYSTHVHYMCIGTCALHVRYMCATCALLHAYYACVWCVQLSKISFFFQKGRLPIGLPNTQYSTWNVLEDSYQCTLASCQHSFKITGHN